MDQAVFEFEAHEMATIGTPKDEPWGQRVVRFASPSGAVSEFSETTDRRTIVTDVTTVSGG